MGNLCFKTKHREIFPKTSRLDTENQVLNQEEGQVEPDSFPSPITPVQPAEIFKRYIFANEERSAGIAPGSSGYPSLEASENRPATSLELQLAEMFPNNDKDQVGLESLFQPEGLLEIYQKYSVTHKDLILREENHLSLLGTYEKESPLKVHSRQPSLGIDHSRDSSNRRQKKMDLMESWEFEDPSLFDFRKDPNKR